MCRGFECAIRRLDSGETLARPLLLRCSNTRLGRQSRTEYLDAVPFNLCVACPEQKSSRTNRAALATASECNMVLCMESLVHSIKGESRLRGQPMANFQPGKCRTWNGNARFVAQKVGLDEALPEVQISLFCAFRSRCGGSRRTPMLSGQHEHRDPRRRQLFGRLSRYLCRGGPASSQASNWVRFNFRRERRCHRRMQKALSASADLAMPERMSRTYARVLRRDEVVITRCCSSRAAASGWRCDINLTPTLGHGHQRPSRMYTKVDRTSTSTAAL